MKKFTLLLLLFAGSFSTLKAEEKAATYASDSFAYGTLGGIAPLYMFPIAGLGFRTQHGNNGFDIGIQGTGISSYFLLKANATYLYYPNPNLKDQFYYGAGVGVEQVKKGTGFSPEFVVGKQYLTDTGGRRFIETQVTPFVMNKHGHGAFIPGVIVRYGIGF